MDLIPTIRLKRIDELPLGYVIGDSDLRRFLNHLKMGENGCVLFDGKLDKDGYGQFSVYHNGFRYEIPAQRWVMHFMNQGLIPRRLLACHHCDNPPCVRPDHIYAGTPKDNVDDMIKRGRAAHQKKQALELII